MTEEKSDILNLFIAIVLSFVIILSWNIMVPDSYTHNSGQSDIDSNNVAEKAVSSIKKVVPPIPVNKILKKQNDFRVNFENNYVTGSFNAQELKLDNLTLNRYNTSTTANSPAVTMLSPALTYAPYFIKIGWLTSNSSLQLPDSLSNWTISPDDTPKDGFFSTKLSWISEQNIEYLLEISLDDQYMFNFKQTVINRSDTPITVSAYNKIQKKIVPQFDSALIEDRLITVIDSDVDDSNTYSDIQENIATTNKGMVSWLGISEKYWLTALIPSYTKELTAEIKGSSSPENKVQLSWLTDEKIIQPNENFSVDSMAFIGAKQLKILDAYKTKLNIDAFDKAIDFGWFYFLNKPMFYVLNFLNDMLNNIGISILLLTILTKILLFPLAKKQFLSMQAMKKLQPHIETIKKNFEGNQMLIQQNIAKLYKEHKLSPLSGCLPVLLQIPIFFSLYTVLSITIEVRHASFFNWITDLSAPDYSSIFNLLGLIDWTPPGVLQIGIWPAIMAFTMYLQIVTAPQTQNTPKIMMFMPLMLMYVFASFPIGLIIFWSWSNILTVLQQFYFHTFYADVGDSKAT